MNHPPTFSHPPCVLGVWRSWPTGSPTRRRATRTRSAAWATHAQRRLLRTAVLLTGDHQRAEDLVQQAWSRWPCAGAGCAHGRPEAYARTVIVRDNISWWRKHRREVLVEPPERGTRDQLAVSDRRLLLDDALAALTPRRSGRSWCSATTTTSPSGRRPRPSASPVGTVKSQTHLALRRLAEAAPELADLLGHDGRGGAMTTQRLRDLMESGWPTSRPTTWRPVPGPGRTAYDADAGSRSPAPPWLRYWPWPAAWPCSRTGRQARRRPPVRRAPARRRRRARPRWCLGRARRYLPRGALLVGAIGQRDAESPGAAGARPPGRAVAGRRDARGDSADQRPGRLRHRSGALSDVERRADGLGRPVGPAGSRGRRGRQRAQPARPRECLARRDEVSSASPAASRSGT